MKRIFFILILSLPSYFATAQKFMWPEITYNSIDDWNKVKNDTTYVIMDSLSSPKNEAYKAVFIQYWKASPIRFIDVANYKNCLSPNVSYFGIVFKWENFPGILTPVPMMRIGLWRIDDKYFKKQRDWNFSYMQNIVSIDPYYNVDRMTKEVEEAKRERKSGEASTLRYTNIGLFLGMVHIGVGTSTVKEAKNPTQNSEKQKVVEEQLKADGGFMMAPYAEIGDSGLYINNWGQGMLKNYIQMTTAMLARGKTGETTIKKEELKNLKSDTLYVPEYIKYVSGLAGVGRTAATDPRELFSSYKHNYSVVSVADLNKKIMQSTSDMYYIMFISGMGGNTLYVVNGFTGTVVYSTNITLGTSLDSGDIKDLSQKVNKS